MLVGRLETIPEGAAGLQAKLRTIRDFVEGAKRDPGFRQRTLELLEGVPEKAYGEEIAALVDFVRGEVVYRRDPAGLETITDPRLLLEQALAGRAYEDCDGHVALLSALLETAGHRTRYRVGGLPPDRYRHIWLEVDIPGQGWTAIELTRKDPAPPIGWDPSSRFPLTETHSGLEAAPMHDAYTATVAVLEDLGAARDRGERRAARRALRGGGRAAPVPFGVPVEPGLAPGGLGPAGGGGGLSRREMRAAIREAKLARRLRRMETGITGRERRRLRHEARLATEQEREAIEQERMRSRFEAEQEEAAAARESAAEERERLLTAREYPEELVPEEFPTGLYPAPSAPGEAVAPDYSLYPPAGMGPGLPLPEEEYGYEYEQDEQAILPPPAEFPFPEEGYEEYEGVGFLPVVAAVVGLGAQAYEAYKQKRAKEKAARAARQAAERAAREGSAFPQPPVVAPAMQVPSGPVGPPFPTGPVGPPFPPPESAPAPASAATPGWVIPAAIAAGLFLFGRK